MAVSQEEAIEELVRRGKLTRQEGAQRLLELRNPEGTVLEAAGEIARAGIQNTAAESASGLAGLAVTAAQDIDEGVEAIDATREALSFEPQTQKAQRFLTELGDIMQPIGEGIAGADRFFRERGAELLAPFGEQGEAVGSALGATILPIAGIVGPGGAAVRFTKPTPFKQKVKEAIESGTQDNITAQYMVTGSGRVRRDPIAMESIRQGFDEGVIAAVKGADPADRQKMSQMLDVLERGRENARFSVENRPSDIVGDSIKDRVLVVRNINRQAGGELEAVANSLKGQRVDYSGPVDQFIDDLADMGATLRQDGSLSFRGSDIEGIKGAENVIKNVVLRMRNSPTPDAFEVHRLKRFIDEHVTFGKNAEGLAGKSEIVLKSLRANLDELLDSTFPRYNDVNTRYSESISALDAFQDSAGRKVDLLGPNADKAIGTVARRLMSNTQSRVNMFDAINELNTVSGRYSTGFSDDILTQAMFVDELENVFGPAARTSLQGEVKKGVKAVARDEGFFDLAVDKVADALDRARGINEEAAIKSMRALLED